MPRVTSQPNRGPRLPFSRAQISVIHGGIRRMRHMTWRQWVPRMAATLGSVVVAIGMLTSDRDALAQGGMWTTRAPMPSVRDSIMVATIDQQLYVAGGIVGGCCDFVNTLQVYNIATNSWSQRSPMLEPRGAGGAAVIDRKLYIVGGNGPAGFLGLRSLQVYDPVTDLWTPKAPMPTPRRWPVVAAIDGLLYVAGGIDEDIGGYQAALEVYDPKTDAWVARASLPVPECCMASGVINGKLYVAGSVAAGDIVRGNLFLYDPAADTWAARTPMPTPRGFPGGEVIDSRLYVVTGVSNYSTQSVTNKLEVYDPASNSWSTDTPIPTPRDRLGQIASVDGKLYVVAGSRLGGVSNLEVFTPASPNAPACNLTSLLAGPPKQMRITVQDTGDGLRSIVPITAVNVELVVPAFSVGFRSPIIVTATKIDQTKSSQVALRVMDVGGNVTECDPILTEVGTDGRSGAPRSETFRHVARADSLVTVMNGTPGVERLKLVVNGSMFEMRGLADSETRQLEVSAAMRDGNNRLTLTAHGKTRGTATVLIADN
jgi:N-acetylneuraminic acid mutarotase